MSDDVIYALLLILSIPFGLLFRYIHGPKAREILSTIAGLLLIILTCRRHAWHSFLTTAVNTCIVTFTSKSKYCHALSFVWCFSYLAFFRTCHWFAMEEPSPLSNAVQLLLTLKLIGVAGEVMETERLKRNMQGTGDHTDVLKLKFKGINGCWYHLISYSFCYIGALTGPYYTCRSFQDMLNNKSKHLPLWSDLKRRLIPLPLSVTLFVFLSWLVSVKRAKEDDFYEQSTFFYRWGYLYLLFIWFRVRFYSAWIGAESMAVTAGLGAYPTASVNKPGAGPTNLQALEHALQTESSKIDYDYETIQNIRPFEIEKSSSVRTSIRYWNMGVQYWLVTNVYKNIPIRNKFIRGTILMVISAFWHGVHPGWYATFLSAPFLLLAEDGMEKAIKQRLTSATHRKVYDLLACFLTMRSFEYFVVGTFFLHYHQIWRYWASLYFYGHFVLAVSIVITPMLSLLFAKNRPKPHQS